MGQPSLIMTIMQEMDEAEKKAWDALARYKFWMFGYWAAIWVHLNRVSGAKLPNPFAVAVQMARKIVSQGGWPTKIKKTEDVHAN